ncbi:MAG: biotin/lipoyl-containing protein [Bryobacteraceae bacterium]
MKYDIVAVQNEGKFSLNGNSFRYEAKDSEVVEREFSVEPGGPGRYSILIEGRSYAVAMLPGGGVSVNGTVIPVEVIDPREYRRGNRGSGTEGRQQIAAMMPGRVVNILVEVGSEVEAGQGLIVVEAMKMQNEMKSPKSGKVTEVRAKAGAAVAAGELLMVIE